VERDTVKSYFAKVNAQGGVGGRQLVMVACDGKYDQTATDQCGRSMVDSHVLAMVGVTAPQGEDKEVGILTDQQQIPWVGGLGTPEEYKHSLSYPVAPSFGFQGFALANELKAAQAKSPYYRHPAILYINDIPWASTVVTSLQNALHKLGIQETTVVGAAAANPDYTGQVSQLQQNHDQGPCASPSETANVCPDSLIAATDPNSYARLFTAMERVGWYPPIVAGGLDKGTDQSPYDKELGCSSCGGSTLQQRQAQSLNPFLSPLDPASSSNATVKDYLDTVNKYFPSQVPALDVYTQDAWSAAQVFVEAAKRANSSSGGLTRASLVDALNGLKNFATGWSTSLSYSAGAAHDPNHCYYYMQHDPKRYDDGGTWRVVSALQCY
jgi:ABC-type branched-subunit amino acid transport system substrate-binding protein